MRWRLSTFADIELNVIMRGSLRQTLPGFKRFVVEVLLLN